MTYAEHYAVAEVLGETSPQALGLIRRIIQELGIEETRRFVEQARTLDAAGSMLTEDGSRQRTLGGIFFYIVKQWLREQGRQQALDALFPRRAPRSRQKKDEPAPLPVAQVASGPPIHQGRLRPRVRGSTTQPPLSTLGASSAGPQAVSDERAAPSALSVPTQSQVLAALSRAIGPAPDIYRRSYHPSTGALTLMAYFPTIARERYAAGIAAAAAEMGVPIGLSDEPHQHMLIAAAQAALPEDLQIGRMSVQQAKQSVRVTVAALPEDEIQAAAQQHFRRETGWSLEFVIGEVLPVDIQLPLNASAAVQLARRLLPISSGCYAIGAQQGSQSLLIRFAFPDMARQTYASALEQIQQRSGWTVSVHPAPHQEYLAAAALAALPEIIPIGRPSIRADTHELVLQTATLPDTERLTEAQTQFQQQTGWQLVLLAR